jgi:hypothetical protein
MPNITKRNTWIFRLAVYSSVLILSYLGVAVVSDIYVRDKAHKFCRGITEGDTASRIVEFAMSAEAMQADEQLTIRRDTADSLIIEFPGLTPFDGYACSINSKNDAVVSKKFLELP